MQHTGAVPLGGQDVTGAARLAPDAQRLNTEPVPVMAYHAQRPVGGDEVFGNRPKGDEDWPPYTQVR